MSFSEILKSIGGYNSEIILGSEKDLRKPIITTGDIFLDVFDINEKNNEITFLIPKSRSETLYDSVTQLESDLIDLIVSKLPAKCQKVFSDNLNSYEPLIHSNYTPILNMLILKGPLDSIQFCDFNENPIDYHSLTRGTYKFIINAEKAYFGPHPGTSHITKLRLQLTKVFYKDNSSKIQPNVIAKGLMSDEDDMIECDCPKGMLGHIHK